MSMNAEFYESAVRSGYYGVDRSGLFGKKDNVRKFWEDMSIKLLLRPTIEQILRPLVPTSVRQIADDNLV